MKLQYLNSKSGGAEDFVVTFLSTFFLLFLSLLCVKALLVSYRMATGKWPKSVHYVWSIIDWRKEFLKVAGVAAAAFLLARYFNFS